MTMSEAEFADLMRGYRDVEPPTGLGAPNGVQRRITRIRRRRTTMIVSAVALILVAVWLSVPRFRGEASHPAQPIDLPSSWTAADGVTYRRLAVVDLDAARQQVTSVTVNLTGAPMAVLAACESAQPTPDSPRITRPSFVRIHLGSSASDYRQANCLAGSTSLSTQLHTRVKLFDFDTSAQVGTATFTITREGGPAEERWTFGVYTWEVPATLNPPPTPPTLPDTALTWHLQHQYTGIWPADRGVSFTIPAGTKWAVLSVCPESLSGEAGNVTDLAGNAMVAVNGTMVGGAGCDNDFQPGEVPQEWTQTTAQQEATVTVTIEAGPIFDMRGGSWSIGVYY